MHVIFGNGPVGRVLAQHLRARELRVRVSRSEPQFEQPLILDTSAFETTFAVANTDRDVALRATLDWYRLRSTRVHSPSRGTSPAESES